jgi:hypothetical protein
MNVRTGHVNKFQPRVLFLSACELRMDYLRTRLCALTEWIDLTAARLTDWTDDWHIPSSDSRAGQTTSL